MKNLELIKPGTKVWVKSDNPFQVEVEGIQINTKEMLISYHIFWWAGIERKDLWLKEDEIEVQRDPTIKVGFK